MGVGVKAPTKFGNNGAPVAAGRTLAVAVAVDAGRVGAGATVGGNAERGVTVDVGRAGVAIAVGVAAGAGEGDTANAVIKPGAGVVGATVGEAAAGGGLGDAVGRVGVMPTVGDARAVGLGLLTGVG